MQKKLIRITTVPRSMAGLLNGQLKFMTNYFKVIGISSSSDGFLDQVAILQAIKTIPVEMTRKITPVKDLIAVLKLFRIFKREQPFIVHTHTPKAGTLGMLAARLAGVPNRLHTIAGLPLVEATGFKRALLNFVEKITYACATKIYPNSYGLQEIILENKFTTKSKLKVIGNGSSNGIDTSYYDTKLISESEKLKLKEKLEIAPNDFVFVFAGRLVTDKGINELIRAFVNINDEFNNTKLLLLGPYETAIDPLSDTTLEIIKQHKNIITTGWVDDIRPFFAISNALAFPSYREGFPNVVLQAGAMKLPCIATDINGCNEIIINNENGIIIPVKNTKALFDSMKAMYMLPKKVQRQMGERSRKTIVSKFEQQFVWEAILKEYETL
ncbi:glycosyltransferase family 4 protein [Seonamhaeicola sp.]|uniref:glycosyltransferase family 4 protein n=1 Tax=Seonamhaeicola sp. TaxID=1912245 RepID=UPI002625D45F|nr:glycosyltransferase family 4 protein [Seonamhaeicola sp.]